MNPKALLGSVTVGLLIASPLLGGQHPGEKVDQKSLPAAVQKAIKEKAGNDGKVVSVMREDDPNGKWNYEVTVRNGSKESRFEVDPEGNVKK